MTILQLLAKKIIITFTPQDSWDTNHQWHRKLKISKPHKKIISNVFDPFVSDNLSALTNTGLLEAKILDFGCLIGGYSNVFANNPDMRKWQYTGADINPYAINIAKTNYPSVPFVLIEDNSRLPFDDNSFDVILASGVLQYIQDYKQTLKELCRITRRFLVISRLPTWKYHKQEIIEQSIPHWFHKEQYSLHIFNRTAIESEFAKLGFAIRYREYGSESYHVHTINEPAICNTYLLEKRK